MRLDTSQQMQMDQRMVLAPRMIQSMEILQLPLLALQERIEQEMLANPVLEQEEPERLEGVEERAEPAEREVPEGEQTLVIKEDPDRQKDYERLEGVGEDYGEYLSRSTYQPARRVDGERDAKMEAMQNTAAPSQSLNESLHDQWVFVESEDVVKRAGEVIIDHIDEAGYLKAELGSLRERVEGAKNDAVMEEALRLVQGLEPSGVGARDLRECLLLQLQSQPEPHPLAAELVRGHLKDIEMNRLPQVAKKVGRSMEELQEAMKVVARLDPRPGLQVGQRETPYITPDIVVEYDEANDVYTARLNESGTPSLRISQMYAEMVRGQKVSAEAKEFLRNNIRSARWLIESIEQRKATLLRVVYHVLKTQREFFDHGPLHLKPLPMVDVADVLGIHVGTVSRAVSGKYMQTPLGIYPLRYFFSGGTENAAGESVSWDAIKAKLQEIVDNEDKQAPFNDDELVEELAKHGLKVARRTVAKYRGLMSIPPARRRRQFV